MKDYFKKNVNIAKNLLDIKAISLRPHKPFKFTSGILSPIYIDNRITISYPDLRDKIIAQYIKIIKNDIGLDNIDVVSGTATAAIPHAAFIAQKLNLPMVYVREKKKGHGKENQIEGVVKKGQKVLVIEDHISTGGSLIGNTKAIRNAGGKVSYAIANTNFLMIKAAQNFKKLDIKVFSITDFETIVTTAVKTGYLKDKDKELVLSWASNPEKWGR